ncbi:MAG: hypothetical protein KDK97_10060 [Verrucomicrobiales bacterium]|nr:hypothetical protein [Verrucomicrobiales bacterium]MCP5556869.1 hypothetical protein [Verrucomicrobiaceae bacterium]
MKQTQTKFALIVLLAIATTAPAADNFSQWMRAASFRPDAETQQKLASAPATAEGKHWQFARIERSRGDLILQSSGLVVTKLPAVQGHVFSSRELLAYLRLHLPEFNEPGQGQFSLVNEADKSTWETAAGIGTILKLTTAGLPETACVLSENSPDRWTLSLIQTEGAAAADALAGNLQFTVSPATPLDGCVIELRAALRAIAAPTREDEQKLADAAQAAWTRLMDKVSQFVEGNNGACVPELLGSTSRMVPWDLVAKAFHQPSVSWIALEGNWASTDSDKRFRIEFRSDGTCDLIEFNRKREELRVNLPIKNAADPKDGFALERPNDSKETLAFFGFSNAVQDGIIEKMPEPSTLTIVRDGEKLTAKWLGLAISTSVGGSVNITQPSKGKPKTFEFIPAQD